MKKRILIISLAFAVCSLSGYAQFGGLVNKAKSKVQSSTPTAPSSNNNGNSNSNSGSNSSTTPSNSNITKSSSSGSSSNAQINGKGIFQVESDIYSVNGARRSHTGGTADFPKVNYDEYVKERDGYKKDSRAREPYLGYLPGCDSFFRFRVPVLVAKKLETSKGYLKEDERTKEGSAKYLPAQIKKQEEEIDYYTQFLMPGDPLLKEMADVKDKMVKLSAWCDEYVNNGGYDAHKQKAKEDAFNNQEFPKALSTNPTWEAAARTAVTNAAKSKGEVKILKTVTTTNMWAIKKNDIDIPTERDQYVVVGYSQNGKCYDRVVQVSQAYAGGGTWNNGYSYDLSDVTNELPCSKVH